MVLWEEGRRQEGCRVFYLNVKMSVAMTTDAGGRENEIKEMLN